MRRRYQQPPQINQDAPLGARGIHRDTSGAIIGAYGPDGTGTGTRARTTDGPVGYRSAEIKTPGLDSLAAMQPKNRRPVFDAANGQTVAAKGDVLAARQKLYAEMEAAGPNGLTEEMRKRARELQVTDSGFNQAAMRIKANAAVTSPLVKDTPTITVPPPPAGLTTPPPYSPPTSASTSPGSARSAAPPAPPAPAMPANANGAPPIAAPPVTMQDPSGRKRGWRSPMAMA